MMNEPTMSRLGAAAVAVAGILILGGCSASAPKAASSDTETSAARFVACLTAAGVEAKISSGTGMVVVRDEHASTSGGGPADGALTMENDVDGNSWVAAQSSAYFVNDPDTQDAYAGCEREHSDFAQPEGGGGSSPKLRADGEKQKADALAFARCARDAGFAWVADPAGDAATPGGIALPADLTEQQFRALLDACWSPQSNVTWEVGGEPSFDLLAIMDEFSGAAGAPRGSGDRPEGEK